MKAVSIVASVSLAALGVSSSIDASCIGCWRLRGVDIELLSGERLVGYVFWNPEWVAPPSETPFPEVLLEPIDEPKHVAFSDKIYRIAYPESGLLVTTGEPRRIPLDSLKAVTPRPDSLAGMGGYVVLPTVPEEMVWLLQQREPYAWCEYEWERGVIYWLSYDPRIREDEINCLCTWPWVDLVQWSERFLPLRVTRLEYGWD